MTIVIDYNDTASDICVLLGREGDDWEYYETYPEWWTLRLWLRRN